MAISLFHVFSLASSTQIRAIGLSLSGTLLGTSLLLLHANQSPSTVTRDPPLSSLIRTYTVYTICSFPTLVDYSPSILRTLLSVPVVRDVTEWVVRGTFFAQFVGGDSAHGTVPILERLRAENKGVLFAYSVEVDESAAVDKSALRKGSQSQDHHQPAHKCIVEEMIRSIDVAADFEDKCALARDPHTLRGRKTWVAVKMTALLPDAQSLSKLSSYLTHSRPPLPPSKLSPLPALDVPFPGWPRSSDLDVLKASGLKTEIETGVGPLTQDDISALAELHADLIRICTKAKERGVKIVIDAEYSWYQPAIDAFTLSLQRQFNQLPSPKDKDSSSNANGVGLGGTVQPLVIGTYQAYLRRTPGYLAYSLRDAIENHYALGVKLVRGAYHAHEIAAHPSSPHSDSNSNTSSISPDPHPPVWSHKWETDECYNGCVRLLLGKIKADIEQANGDDDTGRGGGARIGIGVMFGTHNWESCRIVLGELVERGLAEPDGDEGGVLRIGEEVEERLIFGQLYGMSDALTNSLVDRMKSASPMVIKYVPYGALKDVMPYLSRRAIENKSVLGDGGAADERRRAGAAIWKRIFG